MSGGVGASALPTGLSPEVEPCGLDGSATSIPSAWAVSCVFQSWRDERELLHTLENVRAPSKDEAINYAVGRITKANPDKRFLGSVAVAIVIEARSDATGTGAAEGESAAIAQPLSSEQSHEA